MPTKKSTTKSPKAVKSTTPRKVAKKPAKTPPVKSLRLSKSETPFLTVKPNIQSIYWVILGLVVIGFAVWILKLQADIDSIYDSISSSNSLVKDSVAPHAKR